MLWRLLFRNNLLLSMRRPDLSCLRPPIPGSQATRPVRCQSDQLLAQKGTNVVTWLIRDGDGKSGISCDFKSLTF